MIISKTPLRISLGGGGTDLPSYYLQHGGFLISAAIDKYIYILINKTFDSKFLLKYSELERVSDVDEIKHPIIRETIKLLKLENEPLEICSVADMPAGTGLGSSSAFTVGLLKALHAYKGDIVSTRTLAEEACHIEIDILGERIGKQDQYIAAYGGITTMEFRKDGYVWVDPLNISNDTFYNLEDGICLYYTGYTHSASEILVEQDAKTKSNNDDMIRNLDFVKELGYQSKDAFETGDLNRFADIMNIHWEYKKKRSGKMSNKLIDDTYSYALQNGALGGKLIGAGGGGLLLFYTNDKVRLRKAMKNTSMEEIRFKFEKQGAHIIL